MIRDQRIWHEAREVLARAVQMMEAVSSSEETVRILRNEMDAVSSRCKR